jgi:hypothetical protein
MENHSIPMTPWFIVLGAFSPVIALLIADLVGWVRNRASWGVGRKSVEIGERDQQLSDINTPICRATDKPELVETLTTGP